MTLWWPEPAAGDIVWRHFPDGVHPRSKPRPALLLVVFDDDAPEFTVRVAYGTSQRTTALLWRRGRQPSGCLRGCQPQLRHQVRSAADTRFTLLCRLVQRTARRTEWADAEAGNLAPVDGARAAVRISRGVCGVAGIAAK